MKVLGHTDDGYIVEITESEARRIFDNKEVKTGAELDIKAAYVTVDTIRNLDKFKLENAMTQTRLVLDQLEEIHNTVQSFTLFHTLSTTKEN